MNKPPFFRHWDHWWCRSCPPHALAIFRIAFGLFLFVEALTYIPALPALFSNQGLVFPLWTAEPPSLSILYLLSFLYILSTLLLATGTCMRSALLGLIFFYLYYYNLSFHYFPSSYHRLFFVVLLILLFSGADRTFSVRMLWKKGSIYAWEPISILPQRLLAAQITATYIGVSWQKMWLPDWQNGQVLYYSFIGKWGTPAGFWLARVLPAWVYDPLNWIVKLLEFFLPFGLWMRSWRMLAVIAGTIFHVFVAIFMSIWWFVVLPPAYVLFPEPESVHQWLQKRCNRIQ